jgi:hypothetical protein
MCSEWAEGHVQRVGTGATGACIGVGVQRVGRGACAVSGQRGMYRGWAQGHVQRVGTGACTEGG